MTGNDRKEEERPMKRVLALTLMLAAAFTFGATTAGAQETGEKVFDIDTGLYVPGIDDLDNDMTFGLRFGGRPAASFGWSIEGGYLDLNQNNNEPLDGVLGNANGYFFDANGIWYIAGSDFGIFAG